MPDNKSKIDENLKAEKPFSKSMLEFFDSLVVAFVIAMIIRTFLFSTYKIPTGSMLETLQLGDYLIADKLSYMISSPQFGDIAIFEYPLDPRLDYIKRVMGVPGDEIEVINKVVYRNGEKLDEPYVKLEFFQRSQTADFVKKFTVPEGHYLMMGDNRDSSYDSRFWGLVPEKAFKGKSMFIYWSKVPNGPIRWNRILDRTK